MFIYVVCWYGEAKNELFPPEAAFYHKTDAESYMQTQNKLSNTGHCIMTVLHVRGERYTNDWTSRIAG